MEGKVGSVAAAEIVDIHDDPICSLSEYVPVIFAQHTGEAEDFKCVLEEFGIPTLIESSSNTFSPLSALSRRVPVLVPGEMLEDASELVAQVEQQIAVQFDDYDGVDDDDVDDDDDDDDIDEFDDDDDDDDDLDEDEDY
jgi:hypothetical protein